MATNQKGKNDNREIPVTVVREFSPSNDELRRQRIADKAYELYQIGGCRCGRDVDDWLEAERLVLSEMAAEAQRKVHRQRRGGKGSRASGPS